MTDTLAFDPDAVPLPRGHFIDGAPCETAERAIAARRPSDGAVYGTVPDGGADTVDRAVSAAARAFARTDRPTRPPRDRARVLRRWAGLVQADAPALARLEAVGTTRPVKDALAWDVPSTAEDIRCFAGYADQLGGTGVVARPPAALHAPTFDFDGDALPLGVAFREGIARGWRPAASGPA